MIRSFELRKKIIMDWYILSSPLFFIFFVLDWRELFFFRFLFSVFISLYLFLFIFGLFLMKLFIIYYLFVYYICWENHFSSSCIGVEWGQFLWLSLHCMFSINSGSGSSDSSINGPLPPQFIAIATWNYCLVLKQGVSLPNLVKNENHWSGVS